VSSRTVDIIGHVPPPGCLICDGFMFMLGVVGALVYLAGMLALLVAAWSWGRDRHRAEVRSDTTSQGDER
jgi:hypothetical protein